jgi:ribonuclease HII
MTRVPSSLNYTQEMLRRQWIADDSVEVGLDEAGRGTLWGRLYVGAVVMSPEDEGYSDHGDLLGKIKDSKKLTKRLRAILNDYIRENAIDYAVTWSEPEEIDTINILQADMAAMHRALSSLVVPFQRILVDGNYWSPWRHPETQEVVPYETIEKGDSVSLPIAGASILAKEAHDRWVIDQIEADQSLDERYGFSSNMGYGTAKHLEGLGLWGPHSLHRKSFGPCKDTGWQGSS